MAHLTTHEHRRSRHRRSVTNGRFVKAQGPDRRRPASGCPDGRPAASERDMRDTPHLRTFAACHDQDVHTPTSQCLHEIWDEVACTSQSPIEERAVFWARGTFWSAYVASDLVGLTDLNRL
jgi:hypothetical protein